MVDNGGKEPFGYTTCKYMSLLQSEGIQDSLNMGMMCFLGCNEVCPEFGYLKEKKNVSTCKNFTGFYSLGYAFMV